MSESYKHMKAMVFFYLLGHTVVNNKCYVNCLFLLSHKNWLQIVNGAFVVLFNILRMFKVLVLLFYSR
ncbi:hypothetical protein EUTSA_v10001230mg [Eutrema salsugineum]|uniref:Uncharacterized protein n=1 Tax=Eutrema salsugineum TaxID=72664 RepID=V4N3K0_EUTSA|nr:hypothetical protein EUTSA_v10001230mg [Eutrema salsugineum]